MITSAWRYCTRPPLNRWMRRPFCAAETGTAGLLWRKTTAALAGCNEAVASLLMRNRVNVDFDTVALPDAFP